VIVASSSLLDEGANIMDRQQILDNQIPVIAAFSGGKDSTAMVLYLLYESGIPKEQLYIVFADTGWEHEYTYEQVKLMSKLHPVDIVKSKKYPGGIFQLMKERGIPTRLAQFCTHELKLYPVREYKNTFTDYVSVYGIRKDEGTHSNNRGNKNIFEFDLGTMHYNWYPIYEYTLQDIWDIHDRYNFPRNKLYDLGCTRVGCFPCIYTKKSELALLKNAPDRVSQIREIEETRGTTYFYRKTPERFRDTVTKVSKKSSASIAAVIRWATEDKSKGTTESKNELLEGTCSEGLCE
jgi:3'-phosphoadenosine 5'-phosphosulfate sulfotransferase (PAPS reductase)/FAD synthetase